MVERCDDAAHTERKALLISEIRAIPGKDGLALGGEQSGVVPKPLGHPGQLCAGLGDRSSVVVRFEGVERLAGVLDGIGDAEQQLGSVAADQIWPRSVLECPFGGGDRQIDAALVVLRNGGDHLAGGGVEDVAELTGQRR